MGDRPGQFPGHRQPGGMGELRTLVLYRRFRAATCPALVHQQQDQSGLECHDQGRGDDRGPVFLQHGAFAEVHHGVVWNGFGSDSEAPQLAPVNIQPGGGDGGEAERGRRGTGQ